MQSDGVGALVGGPNSPLVFDDKSNPSTTTVGITNVELSNSTFRCLNEPELNLLAETLAAVEEARGGEWRVQAKEKRWWRLHPALWTLVAVASVGTGPAPYTPLAHEALLAKRLRSIADAAPFVLKDRPTAIDGSG